MKGMISGLALSFLFSSAALAKNETFKIDTARSVVRWTGSKVIGGSHTGTLKVKEGSVVYVDGKPSTGNVIIDMKSIVDEDLKDKEMNQKLVNHLSSPDFFDVEKHPTASLKIDRIDALKDGEYQVKGTITIKGHSKPVAFTGRQKDDKGTKVVDVDLKLDRTDFDVRYGSGKFFQNLGDKVIADEINLKLEVLLTSDVKSAKK